MKYEDLIESKQFLVSVSAYGRTYAVRVDDIREFMQSKVVVDREWLALAQCPDRNNCMHGGEPCQWCDEFEASLQPTTSGDVAKPCEFCGFPHKKSQRVHGECPHCEGCWLGPQPAETNND